MRNDSAETETKLFALAEAVRLTKEAYAKTKDGRLAQTAFVLAQLAMDEAETICRKDQGNEPVQR